MSALALGLRRTDSFAITIIMSDVVKTLRSELDALERELLADARYVKVQRIKELLAAYSPEKKTTPTPPQKHRRRRAAGKAIRGDKGSLGSKLAPSINAGSSKSKKVRREIETLLTPGPLHRKDILAHLISKGLMGKEKTPMASLAAYLSGWRDQFESDGSGNFKLRAEEGH